MQCETEKEGPLFDPTRPRNRGLPQIFYVFDVSSGGDFLPGRNSRTYFALLVILQSTVGKGRYCVKTITSIRTLFSPASNPDSRSLRTDPDSCIFLTNPKTVPKKHMINCAVIHERARLQVILT
jgi:hypothetical protein